MIKLHGLWKPVSGSYHYNTVMHFLSPISTKRDLNSRLPFVFSISSCNVLLLEMWLASNTIKCLGLLCTYLPSKHKSRECTCESQRIEAHNDADEQTDGDVKMIVVQGVHVKLEGCFDRKTRLGLLNHCPLHEIYCGASH